MRFSELLEHIMVEKNYKSSSQLYEALGAKEGLGCSKRAFDLVRSGERNPSAAFFVKFFDSVPHPFKKLAIEAYFETAIHVNELEGSSLMKFLEVNLSPGVPEEHESVWDKNEEKLYYLQPQQLEYMINNHSALRLFIRTLLYEKVPNVELLSVQEEVKQLNKFGLTKLGREGLELLQTVVKVPTHANSSKRVAELGMRYILEHIPAFVDYGENNKQVIAYGMQRIRREHVPMVKKAMLTLNKWIQDLGVTDEDNDSTVPYFYVGLGGELNEKDF